MQQNSKKRFILDRAFDAFIIRLNDALIGCHYARSNNEYESWYKAITNVFIELSGYMKTDRDSRLFELFALNQLLELYKYNQIDEDTVRREFIAQEMYLQDIINKNKLQEKKADYSDDQIFI